MEKTKAREKPPEQTFEEVKYLRRLIENRTPVCVCLAGGGSYRGVIEFYDSCFIRLTREDGPNLFLYKKEIKYLYEPE
jgi:sRNA-binding regulator protein Hfq